MEATSYKIQESSVWILLVMDRCFQTEWAIREIFQLSLEIGLVFK